MAGSARDMPEAKIIRFAVGHAAPDAAAGHPDGIAADVVIPAVGPGAVRCPAHLAGPDDEGAVEQSA